MKIKFQIRYSDNKFWIELILSADSIIKEVKSIFLLIENFIFFKPGSLKKNT